MRKMLEECEKEITFLREKINEIRKQPETAERDYRIMQWEEMLNDVRQRAGQIKKYMEGGNKK